MLAKVVDSRTALPCRASQPDGETQVSEGVLGLGAAQARGEFGNEETRVLGLGEDSIPYCGIVLQGVASRRMQRDQAGLSELGLINMEDTVGEIHILTIQSQAFADAQAGDGQQSKQRSESRAAQTPA